MHNPIRLNIVGKTGTEERVIPIGSVSMARFTSRDLEGTRKKLDDMIAQEGRYSGACLANPMFLFGGATEVSPSLASEVSKRGLPAMACHGVGDSFLVQLIDPVLDRVIEHRFKAVPVGDDYDERKERGIQRAPHH